jgi:hypothetical protein
MNHFSIWYRASLLTLVLGVSACTSDRMPYGVEPGDLVSVRFQGGGGITRCRVVSFQDRVFVFQVIRKRDDGKGLMFDNLVSVPWPRINLIADIYVDMEG